MYSLRLLFCNIYVPENIMQKAFYNICCFAVIYCICKKGNDNLKIAAGRLENLVGISGIDFSSFASLPEMLVAKLERAKTPELTRLAQHVFFTPRYFVISAESIGFYLAQLRFSIIKNSFHAATFLEKQDILIKHPALECSDLPGLTNILNQEIIFMSYGVAAEQYYSGQLLSLFDPAGNSYFTKDAALLAGTKAPSTAAKTNVVPVPDELTFAEAALCYRLQDPDLKKLVAAITAEKIKPFAQGDKYLFKRTDLNVLYGLPADTKVVPI